MLAAQLRSEFSAVISSGKFELVEGDVIEFDQTQIRSEGASLRYKVVANIPYYITGALIRKFLTTPLQPERMVLLVQKEIAERIARSKKESILSLSVQAYGTPRYVAKVPRGSFSPPPKVDSAILLVADISRKHFANRDESLFFEIVRTGFSAKRKLLASNLAARFGRESVVQAMAACAISEKTRAEDLPLDAWLTLADALAPLIGNSPSS